MVRNNERGAIWIFYSFIFCCLFTNRRCLGTHHGRTAKTIRYCRCSGLGGSKSTPKVPSLFAYDPQGGSCWGHNIREGSLVFRRLWWEPETSQELGALEALRRTPSEADRPRSTAQDVAKLTHSFSNFRAAFP